MLWKNKQTNNFCVFATVQWSDWSHSLCTIHTQQDVFHNDMIPKAHLQEWFLSVKNMAPIQHPVGSGQHRGHFASWQPTREGLHWTFHLHQHTPPLAEKWNQQFSKCFCHDPCNTDSWSSGKIDWMSHNDLCYMYMHLKWHTHMLEGK